MRNRFRGRGEELIVVEARGIGKRDFIVFLAGMNWFGADISEKKIKKPVVKWKRWSIVIGINSGEMPEWPKGTVC